MAEELLDIGKFAGLPWCEVPSWYLRSLAFGNTDKNGKEWPPHRYWGGRAKAELFRRENSGVADSPKTDTPKPARHKPQTQTNLVSMEEHLMLVARVAKLEQTLTKAEKPEIKVNPIAHSGAALGATFKEVDEVFGPRPISLDEDDIPF